MLEILFLLLPLAFYSGWRAATKPSKTHHTVEQPNSMSERFVQGINYLLNEEPDKALDVFLKYPDVDEQTANTFLLLGNSFRNRGEVNRALRVHQNLIARPTISKAQRVNAMLALGEDFFAAGLLDRAESVFTEILKDDPKQVAACEPLRAIYEKLHEWDKAIEITQCVQQQGQTDHSRLIAHYYCELAAQALNNKNLFEAEANLKAAEKIYPQSSRVKVLKADLAYSQGQTDAALALYEQAIRQDSRLLGMLFKQLLSQYPELTQRQALFEFTQALYQQTREPRVFMYLLQLAQLVGQVPTIQPLVTEHLQKGQMTLNTAAYSSDILVNYWQQNQACDIADLQKGLHRLAKSQPEFQCTHCGYKMQDYLWRCPACHRWDTVSAV